MTTLRNLIEALEHVDDVLPEADLHTHVPTEQLDPVLLCVRDSDQELDADLMRELGWEYDGDTGDWQLEITEGCS